MSELNDKIIGGFRVLQEIQAGSGSQGTVYKAVCEVDKFGFVTPGTVVALKVMAVQDDGKQQWKKLEKRTAELSRLNHPNVVRYYGCFSESGLFNDVHVVVQEFLDGETLKERLVKCRSGLDVDLGLKVADAALAGLEYISRCGIVHRDVKPGNIFVCANGAVKLIDFEIAKQRGGTTTSTAGNIRGSFDYMAPDFTDAEFHGDEKSDVFSMGVVVHEILVGKTPYQRLEGEGKQANFAFLSRWSRALTEDSSPIYISSRVKRLLAHATEILEKALAPKREERYSGFSEFREALKTVKFRTLRNGSRSYQVLQFIGKGGFGEVFKARLRGTDRLVAVKHLLKAAYAERFYREAKIMKKLNDPCFVRLVDFFTMDIGGSKEAFLVMAFLDGMPGSSLRDAIRGSNGAGLDAHDVFTAFERYAHGLGVMHASGIFHRDIKPSNLYYPAESVGLAAIMDLGIARDVNGTATHGQVPGTLDYMPPEVVLTDNRGDGGMDVYALGLCLYEALTGKTAYPRLPSGTASYTAFLERAKNKSTPEFSHEAVASDSEILALLKEMTDLDPERRIKNANEVSIRLKKILDTRYGGPKVHSAAPAEDDDSPETVATTIAMDPATVATQWGGVSEKDIRIERRRHLLKRVGLPLAFVLLLAVPSVYYGWKPAVEFASRFSKDATVVLGFRKQIDSCILADGLLHEGNYAELDKVEIPVSRSVLSSLSGNVTELGKAISCSIRANLKVEPALTRRIRLNRARQLLGSRWASLALPPGEAALLKREIANAESWCVSIVKNACANSIWVDGTEIPVGGSKVMVYEDGHPENGIVSRPGFKTLHLPKDIDGKVHEVTDEAFVAKPVRFSLPTFADDVFCELEGRRWNSGETVELMPGYYKCRFMRDTYKTQEVTFSVYANAEVKVPEPREWVHTDEFIVTERKRKEAEAKKLAEEKKRREAAERQRADEENRKAIAARQKAEEERRKAEEVKRLAEEAKRKAPVVVTLPSLPQDVVCRVDGSVAEQSISLAPGSHRCVYSREDYDEQSFEFKVSPAAAMTLPPPGVWNATPGLKRLEAAEAAAKSGDWIKAEAAIQFADVVSEVNRRKKQAIASRIASQSELSEKRDQAELYFAEGMYYDAAKYYSEAAEAGYALTQKDRKNFEKAYATQKKRLQVMIDRCHKDIALGKSPIRPLADLEKEMRQLIEWNTKVKGRR
ncbi:MAG: hypothetical protein E7046_00210 [Lentisphaerae bacterium]|nr:hypothetical protein [Lentisphaerota bacterium]